MCFTIAEVLGKDVNISGFFFWIKRRIQSESNFKCFFLSQEKKNNKTTTKITDTSPSLGVISPTAHELSILMFVLRKKTRNNEHFRACFFNLSCPLLHNPCHLRENSPPLKKTTVKSSCDMNWHFETKLPTYILSFGQKYSWSYVPD